MTDKVEELFKEVLTLTIVEFHLFLLKLQELGLEQQRRAEGMQFK